MLALPICNSFRTWPSSQNYSQHEIEIENVIRSSSRAIVSSLLRATIFWRMLLLHSIRIRFDIFTAYHCVQLFRYQRMISFSCLLITDAMIPSEFWLKESIYYDQPTVQYKYQLLLQLFGTTWADDQFYFAIIEFENPIVWFLFFLM